MVLERGEETGWVGGRDERGWWEGVTGRPGGVASGCSEKLHARPHCCSRAFGVLFFASVLDLITVVDVGSIARSPALCASQGYVRKFNQEQNAISQKEKRHRRARRTNALIRQWKTWPPWACLPSCLATRPGRAPAGSLGREGHCASAVSDGPQAPP